MNQEFKTAILSKTLWVAVIQGAIGVIVVLSDMYPTAGWVIVAKSIVDIALRLITTQPVKLK